MTLENFRNTPFRMQDMSSVFPDCVNLATKAKRLERDGEIIRLKKGLYVASPLTSRVELSPFLIANHIYVWTIVCVNADSAAILRADS